MSQSRQLAAIMFTDIVGYTALMGEDEQKAFELLKKNRLVQRPIIEKHNGNWLKEIGDGVLASFPTVTDAVYCAKKIQQTCQSEEDLRLRIGIHLGEVVFEDNDVFGDGVNIASRLEPLAPVGGILVSESVHNNLINKKDVESTYVGEKQLKNVKKPVKVYQVQVEGVDPLVGFEPSTTTKQASPRTTTPRSIVFAVMGIIGILFLSYLLYTNLNKGHFEVTDKSIAVLTAHLQIILPADMYLAVDTGYPTLALSPDGNMLVFVGVTEGQRRLYLRRLDDPLIELLSGTETAVNPFFSTDGSWVGFFKNKTVMKVSTSGGLPVAVHVANPPGVHRGVTWYRNDSLIYSGSANGGLSIGAASGETIHSGSDWKKLTQDRAASHSWPSEISHVKSVLFTEIKSGQMEDSDIAILSLEDNNLKILVNGGTYPKYSPNGFILFARNTSLYTTPFDAQGKKITGVEKELVTGLISHVNGSAEYAVGGTNLVYIQKGEETESEELVWVDRQGSIKTLFSNGRPFLTPRLSPDNSRLALTSFDGPNSDVWLLELSRNSLTRLTSHTGEDFGPVWSPDGKQLAFSSELAEDDGEQGPGIALLSLDSSDPPKRLFRTPERQYLKFPTSWSRDGNWLLYSSLKDDIASIEVVRMDNNERSALDQTSSLVEGAVFSPNGKWIAFVSDYSGRKEIYVKPFLGPRARKQVSLDGGYEPLWSRDGSELFYRENDKFMVVSVQNNTSSIGFSSPNMMFEGPFKTYNYGGGEHNYDVTSDGKRFIMVHRINQPKPKVINVILNWPEL